MPDLTFLASFCALGDVDLPLRVLDQPQHVAHAEDARGHALGMEDFQAVELFGHADELDRRAGHLPHRKRRATARVAVELGQNDAGQRQHRAECLGRIDRILALHRVDDEQRLDRLHRGVQRGDLAHHRVVDGQTPGGVDQHDVVIVPARPVDAATAIPTGS